MSDNNKMPEGWGQNKGVPDSWGKNNNLPENWGNQNSGVKIPSLIHENQINVNEELEMLSNMAKSGTKMLNKAARKAGDSVKNAAGSVVEYVKSDETKEKLNAVKDKAKFIADVTECAVSDIKEKTSDKINKLRLPKSEATVPDNNVSDNVSEDINNDIEETDIAENIEETENSESFDELYEKAMSSADDTEKYDETSDEVTYSAENSVHDENNEESFIATDVDASPGEINEFDTTQAVQPTQIEYAKKKTHVIPCKKTDNSDTNVDDVTEAVNEVTEDNLPDTGTVNNDVEGYSESVSFDELYERSINISDEEEYPDEADDAESSYANDEAEQPAAAELVSPLPDSPAPIQQQSPQRQYSYEEEKKSAIVYVMAGIIAVLLVGGGILGGMLLMKNKDHDDSGSTPGIAAPSVSETTADISSETQNSSTETVTTVSEKPTESVTTSETATVSYSVSDEEFNAAVETFLDSLVSDSLDPISNIQYALFDVNSDGIKELFVTGDHVAGTYTNMYQYTPKKFTVTDIYGEHIKICPDESLIECAEFEGGTVYTYYRISGNTIELEDQLYSYVGQYKHGDVIISESEFNSLLAEKNKLSWLELSYTPFLTQSQNKQTNIPPEYTNYNNIENAPSDMEFFTQSSVIKGKVVTSSTGLNMRTGPGPDFEKMLEIPKDQEVDILGINNDWCYVKWSVLAAGAFQYIDYYGYVSSEYVSTKPNGSGTIINGVTVYKKMKKDMEETIREMKAFIPGNIE